MKIVILTNGSKHGLEIIRQLKKDDINLEAILIEKKMIRKKEHDLLKSKLGKAAFIISLIPFKNFLYRTFRYFKYNDTTLKTLNEFCKTVCKVSNLTGKDCQALLKSIQPDLLILGGSRIIKENILNIPRLGTLNAHPGILPYYRGLDVIKWALFNDDNPGVTVHYVDSSIDTGEICKSEKLQLTNNISIDTLKEQAIKVSAQLMSKTVLEIQKNGKSTTLSNEKNKGKYYTKMPKEMYQKLLEKLSKNEQ